MNKIPKEQPGDAFDKIRSWTKKLDNADKAGSDKLEEVLDLVANELDNLLRSGEYKSISNSDAYKEFQRTVKQIVPNEGTYLKGITHRITTTTERALIHLKRMQSGG